MDKNNFIPLMKVAFTQEKRTCKKLAKFISSIPKLSMGDMCLQFEQEFSRWQGKKYSVLVNSGGSANFLLLQALKNLGRIKEGDAIGFSSLTWSTNVMPIIQHGFKPIPIDCEIKTLNVMSCDLETAIKKYNLKVFFATNVLGFCGDLDEIKKICEENGVIYLEDNCEALGTEYKGIKTGNFGIASTFSFFVAHHMSTIEGGMIATDDYELFIMLTMCRANGWDRNLPKEIQDALRKKYKIESEFESKYAFYDIGMNVRPTEITGFLGLEQLKLLPTALIKREKNYKKIRKMIKVNSELINVDLHFINFIPAFSTPIITKNGELSQKYVDKFKDLVEIRPLIAGNMIKQPFWPKYSLNTYELAGTEFLHGSSFYFGNYPEMDKTDLKILKELLNEV